GATGAGKSVGINCVLLNLLFSAHPDEVKLLLIDPKVLELQVYDGIPHLIRPVITNPKEAARGLAWVVQEMERRYRILAELGVRSIDAYNRKLEEFQATGKKSFVSAKKSVIASGQTEGDATDGEESLEERVPLPYIVVVIDEFADLMMVAPKEIEDRIARLAQMARASGIHLILATQRPSVDVVTGLIKANFPARIAYQVSSKIDSRTILDANGAESLLGKGDMLYLASGTGRIVRLHGPFVSDDEVRGVVDWVKGQASPVYDPVALEAVQEPQVEEQERDETYERARELVMTTGQASASFIQRRLRVGYPRAARMIEQMEEEGLVSAAGRDGKREVLVRGTAIAELG
nr:FtsK/SpoIIIE domain-containing protein [Nitrospirales bacterium]